MLIRPLLLLGTAALLARCLALGAPQSFLARSMLPQQPDIGRLRVSPWPLFVTLNMFAILAEGWLLVARSRRQAAWCTMLRRVFWTLRRDVSLLISPTLSLV